MVVFVLVSCVGGLLYIVFSIFSSIVASRGSAMVVPWQDVVSDL